MKRETKKGLSLLLSATMALSVAAMPVAAETGSAGDTATGSVSEPAAAQAETPAADADTPAADADTPATDADTPAVQAETPAAEAETPAAEAETPAADADTADLMEAVRQNLGNLDLGSLDLSGIEIGDIHPNVPVLTDEQLDEVKNSDDPLIQAARKELEGLVIEGGEGDLGIATMAEVPEGTEGSEGQTAQPLTQDQIDTVLYMFKTYLDYWAAHEDVLGVQLPFYLNNNDNGEDGLGILGQMLVLAGVSVEDVRSGNYSYDNLTGMIMNFQYGDQLGVEYYGTAVESKRDDALEYVESTGAQTEAQKLLALNTWLAQHNTFDMSYIMNQMDPENPIMQAPTPVAQEHEQDVYNTLYAVYKPQIEAQIKTPIQQGVESAVSAGVYQQAISAVVSQAYMATNESASEEDAQAAADQFLQENAEAIAADPVAVLTQYYGADTANGVKAQVDAYMASEEGKATVDGAVAQAMETPMEEMGNMTPNQAIEAYTQQAAQGLTTGVLGYWEGNHIGALASGASVCMGYAKAYAYLVQCMHPEIYGVNGASSDMTDASQWKTYQDVYQFDETTGDVIAGAGSYNVDIVRITFQASVTMYGEPQPEFNSDHFWNAVKLEDGKWYYVDPCYTDVWTEVMIRDRVETDGSMNHTYFLVSDDSLREMLDGNFDPNDGIKTLYKDLANNKDFEDSWIARINSNVYSDGSYFYYLYNSTDLISLLEEYNSSQGNFQNMEVEDAQLKVVRHKITTTDASSNGDTDYETLIDFTHEGSVQVLQDGAMVDNDLLTQLYNQFVTEQEVYPSMSITPVYYNGKIYFNLSNCIMTYDLESGDVVKLAEYNTVYAKRDDTMAFGAMAFQMTDSAEDADFTFQNHPIAGIALKDDGKLYVDVATNLSFIAGRDPHDYTDSSSYGYEFEETNYNPDYSAFVANQIQGDNQYGDLMDQMGYELSDNDNDEFMWVANVVGTLDMAHFAGSSHSYAETEVAAFCGHNAYTENRCTTCGAIEADTRTEQEGTAPAHHHYVPVDETYYTKDDNGNWNTGSSYVCTMCGYSISEPTEPKQTQWEDEEDYQARLEEYQAKKAIYDEAKEVAGHTYVPDDPQWIDDNTALTFTTASCSVCTDTLKLDIFADENTLSTTKWATSVSNSDSFPVTVTTQGTCDQGLTKIYTASGELENGTFTLSKSEELDPMDHTYQISSAWNPIEDEDGNLTFTVTATITCTTCGVSYPDVTAKSVKKDSDNEDGTYTYTATFDLTDAEGNVVDTVTETRDIDPNDLYTGLRLDADGVWRYYNAGLFDPNMTGVVMYGEAWFYVQDGVMNVDFAGLVPYNDGLFYVSAGQVRTDLTGLVQNVDGKWYYLSSGQVRTDTSGRVWYNDACFVIKNGELDTDANGIIEDGGHRYYVSYGQYQLDMTGLVQNVDGKWYYISDGQVRDDFSDLVLYNDNWFVIKNGQLDEGFNGLYQYKYNNEWFLCTAGQLRVDYTGPYTDDAGRVYNIVAGQVV